MATEPQNDQPKLSTVKQLFALSGNLCAFPNCKVRLVEGMKVIGKICHIKARSENGPRYDPEQTNDERRGFDNLILMCPRHHDVIDSDVESYTVERLSELKRNHEKNINPINEEEIKTEILEQLIIHMNIETQVNIENVYQNNGQLASIIVNHMVPDIPIKSIKVRCRILLTNINNNLKELKGRHEYADRILMAPLPIPQNFHQLCEDVSDYLNVEETSNLFTFYDNLNSFNDFIKETEAYFHKRNIPMGLAMADMEVNRLSRIYAGRLKLILNSDINNLIDRLIILSE